MRPTLFLIIGLIASTSVLAATNVEEKAPAAVRAYVDDVFRSHPRVLAAEASVDAADARVRGADRAIYNPEFDAEYEDGESLTRSIGVSQTIDLGNKRGARKEIASAEQQTAMESLSLVRQRC